VRSNKAPSGFFVKPSCANFELAVLLQLTSMTMTTEAKPVAPPVTPSPEARPQKGRPQPARQPAARKRGLNISMPQVMLVVGLIAALSVIINFSSRIQAEQRISAEAARLREDVTAMAATQAAQATELAYVQSDAYVMEWAHSEGRLVQDGEVLVVPVPAATAAPPPAPQAPAPEVPDSNAQIWWELFFSGNP
jgi:hypothetical protein